MTPEQAHPGSGKPPGQSAIPVVYIQSVLQFSRFSTQSRRTDMRANVRLISKDEVLRYLAEVNLQLGEWREIKPIGTPVGKQEWVNVQAPRDARELLRLSQHAAGWLQPGAWKIIQFDNSRR